MTPLWFGAGVPVRAASAIAPFGDGWLVAQDDATHAAWLRPDGVVAVRVVDPVEGHEVFGSAEGTKHLKPDFEAAVALPGGGVLLLGSGSTAARMRASLVTLGPQGPAFTVTEPAPVYRRVAESLGVALDQLNLEGACVIGNRLRWFQRGNSAAGVPSASVDVELPELLIGSGGVRRYDLGTVGGVALSVTDAVALPDGRVVVSAAAEDTPNAVDDGPVVGAVLALLDGERTVLVAPVPDGQDGAYKVEGLAVRQFDAAGVSLIAVVDADDPLRASSRLDLRLHW
ncbi:MAG: hypothetical protein ABW000_02090 [Actinoplanes sp.]